MALKTSFLRIAKGEWRWPLGIALLLMAITFLPYLFGWFITPLGMHYSGFLGNPDDQNVYLAYMRQAQDGQVLFSDLFTTEAQRPWFFHSYFLVLGLFSRITGLSLLLTYHLARLVSGVLLLLALYMLGARFFTELWARRFFMIFIALASGLGWLYVVLLHPTGNFPHPPDFGPGVVMPELITFLMLLLNPLFCIAVFLLVMTLLLLLGALEQRSWQLALLAGVAGMVLANIHSYDMIPLALTVALYLLATSIALRRFVWQEWALAVLVGALAFIPLIYQSHLYRDLPVFRLKAEVATLSPPLLQYLLALGIPLVLAIPGAWLALRRARQDKTWLLPLAWIVATLVSVYLPFPFQRKMAEGLQIPVCLLAILFLMQTRVFITSGTTRRIAAVVLIVICFPSNGFFLGKLVHELQTMGSENLRYLTPPLYLRAEQVQTLAWLNGRIKSDQAIFCNPLLGNYVPPRTGARTYVGHWAETLHYPQKLGALQKFLSGEMPLPERIQLLHEQQIRYLLIGPEERIIAGGAANTTGLPLQEVQRAGEITIYQVE
jgi:hypothetical protein